MSAVDATAAAAVASAPSAFQFLSLLLLLLLALSAARCLSILPRGGGDLLGLRLRLRLGLQPRVFQIEQRANDVSHSPRHLSLHRNYGHR
jgi:hypothetical protein